MQADERTDLFTLIESRLLEGRLAQLLIPSTTPVSGPVGSGFGFRTVRRFEANEVEMPTSCKMVKVD